MKPYLFGVIVTILAAFPLLAQPGPLQPLLPPPLENDETSLLKTARAVEAEIVGPGYRKFPLVAAQLAAWTEEGEVEPKDLLVELYLPAEEHPGPYPLLVYVHGGGFIGGSAALNVMSERRTFAGGYRYVLDHGVAVASVGYRLAREGGWPTPVSDPLCGMRFLQQNGAHWNLLTDRLVLVGHSAGARSVALIGMVPQDDFHTQNLPWREGPVTIAGTYLWAGSALTRPMLEFFGEFGKPRWYSVPRLHHGDHPGWSYPTRHSLRIRNNLPHLSNAMPPLYMVRGASDYGGDHSDAEAAVALWERLGIEATLAVVPGGHSAMGPAGDLLAFVRRHILEQPFTAPAHDTAKTVHALLRHGDPFAALEVLTAAHTTDGGTNPGPGEWLLAIHDLSMIWLPDHSAWPEDDQALANRAREAAAGLEAAAARRYAERSDWFRAAEAARNVRKLIGSTPAMAELIAEVEAREIREADFFRTLHRANTLWTKGEQNAAGDLIKASQSSALGVLLKRASEPFNLPIPDWADRHGVDLYGPWVAMDPASDTAIRFRWIESGEWDLPDYLHYQKHGRIDDETITRIEIQEGFWIAETPVTQAQWQAIANPGAGALDPVQADLPVTRRDYLQIIAWLETLSARRENLLVRLPSEVEWLHAATGGGRHTLVRGGTDLHAVHVLTVDPAQPGPAPVHSVVPDLTGLYGMLGGVLEWTSSGDYRQARFNDERGRMRIFRYPMSRGGAWSSFPHVLDAGTREWHRHGNRQPDLGFRIIIGGDATADHWLTDIILR